MCSPDRTTRGPPERRWVRRQPPPPRAPPMRTPASVWNQPFARELRARVLEGDVTWRQDHVRGDELVVGDLLAIVCDEVEHLLPELVELLLVVGLGGRNRLVVKLVEPTGIVVREVVLPLVRDPNDH